MPRDEAFSALKQATFNASSLNSVLNGLIPALESVSTDNDIRFPHFPAIDDLFDNGVPLPPSKGGWKLATLLPRIIDTVVDSAEDILRFHPPETFDSKNTTFKIKTKSKSKPNQNQNLINISFILVQGTNSSGSEMRNLVDRPSQVSTPTA